MVLVRKIPGNKKLYLTSSAARRLGYSLLLRVLSDKSLNGPGEHRTFFYNVYSALSACVRCAL